MNDVGAKKSFARKPQNWKTKAGGVKPYSKSPFGRKFPPRCRLTFWPTLPPIPVSPGTKALRLVFEPSCWLQKLTQLNPHAAVPLGAWLAASAALALTARLEAATATAEAA